MSLDSFIFAEELKPISQACLKLVFAPNSSHIDDCVVLGCDFCQLVTQLIQRGLGQDELLLASVFFLLVERIKVFNHEVGLGIGIGRPINAKDLPALQQRLRKPSCNALPKLAISSNENERFAETMIKHFILLILN